MLLTGGYEAFSKTSPWLCVTSQQSSFCTQLSDTVTKSQMLNTVSRFAGYKCTLESKRVINLLFVFTLITHCATKAMV